MAAGAARDMQVAPGNTEQAEHWNADEAHHWVAQQARYGAMLAPFGELVLETAALQSGDDVLDIGCGCGDTTLAAARAADDGSALGVDLSEPMLVRARERAQKEGATNVRFELGDAQVHPFPDTAFDVALSRFGVMFFENPNAAFANVARALRPSGRLSFVCWRELEANEWLMVPGVAVAEHVPLPDLGEPNAPGMFAFAASDRVAGILTDAGFADVDIEAAVLPLLVGGGGTLDDAIAFMRDSGIGRTLLADAEPAAAERAFDAARAALEPYATPRGVELGSAVWVVRARRS
ncbi:MAG TPA: methyltransferase domain-containing protein [Acidimicrobiia bacterium]|nr:methyltransferase domain-containing protein [Acidimicrobiia bacterium]